MKNLHGTSWKTTSLGILILAFGAWAFHLHWVESQTVYFNLFYAEIAPIAIFFSGLALIFARDHSCLSEHIKERKQNNENKTDTQ